MPNKPNENTVFSYKNPFDDYNANVLAPELIMQYWCTPFSTGALKEFDERKFFTEKMPIVLQGTRGSGKTTILKYFSFPVQCERAMQNNISVMQQIINDSGVGFYLRCDDSFLNMFKAVFATSLQDAWLNCFKHYLELFFVKNLLNMLRQIDFESSLSEENLLKELHLEQYGEDCSFKTIDEFESYIISEVKYLNKFKNESLFTKAEFLPKHIWDFYDISGALIETIQSHIPALANVNYLLLIDEFENLPTELQKMFNTMIKFCKPGISMRIGRRSENEDIVTKETVNAAEYLRESNDYRLIVLDQWQDIKDIQSYLLGIAEKRLAAFKGIDLSTNLCSILGEKENLDEECTSVATDKNLHMEYLLRANPRVASDPELCKCIIKIISYPQNRIAEALNALWVARSEDGQDLIEAAQIAADAMHAFFEKSDHPLCEKYKNDYNNKYRYALTVAICTAYKRDKAYYSFNTLCYLCEGNARTFINLCKEIISDAIFYEKKEFFSTGKISITAQCRAIKAFSINEFNSVCSIIQNGKAIRNLILNIGNVLSEYHKDKLVRYPETTQFVYNPDDLSPGSRQILDIAESWALIRKRKDPQRLSASIDQEGYLYALNRTFSPIFNISYRIRGGVNVAFSAEDIDKMIAGQKISKLNTTIRKRSYSTTKKAQKPSPDGQLSMY